MKRLFWILFALALGGCFALILVRTRAGYVQFVLPPHRVELALPLVILLLVAGFVLAYYTVRLVSAMVAMPRQVRAYREARKQRKGVATLTEALHEFFSGRYARAEKAAASAMQLSEQPGLAAMLAARAAHELRAPERRDEYLAQGERHLSGGDIMQVITKAELLLKERRAADVLSLLQTLPQKHTAGLRLELQALQLAREYDKSLAVIDQLEKRQVYDAAQANELRALALAEHLKRRATDVDTLDEAWRNVPERLKLETPVVRAAAAGYVALNAGAQASALIERSLERQWDSELAGLYGECVAPSSEAESGTLRQLERAERWLEAHPRDAALLRTLGKLCARQSLWGKARNYLDASLAVEPALQTHLAAAQLEEKLGNAEVAQRHTREALDLALKQLAARSADAG